MKYFVTIYIDSIFDFEGFPHAFLGLTRYKSPDELDKIDNQTRMQKLKNTDWKDFDKSRILWKKTSLSLGFLF